MDKKEMAKILREKGWGTDESRSVVAIDVSGNMMVDETKGVQFIQESMDSIRSGFDDVIKNGPIAKEQVRGVKFVLHHFVPHEDPAHRGLAQLMPATRRAMLGSILIADPVLLEPILGIEIKCPQEQMLDKIGPTLVCSAITEDAKFQRALIDATHIDRLNVGPMPTIKLNWLQPHEGSIVDFLFRARAFQFDKDMIRI